MSIDIPDFQFPVPKIFQRIHAKNTNNFWQEFEEKCVGELMEKGGLIIDIGGGLRIDETRCDRVDPHRQKKYSHYLHRASVDYKVTDYTDQYHPDFVEDIHALSFKDESIDGVFCLAVLEHVYDPKKAAEELMRVLKKGGLGFIYVPFIYRYHANLTEDYRDYFRYSKDGIGYLFRHCASIEICPVRGLFESLLRFTPLHHLKILGWIARKLDWCTKKMSQISERQSSGYFIKIIR